MDGPSSAKSITPRIEALVAALEAEAAAAEPAAAAGTTRSRALPGTWRLLRTYRPGSSRALFNSPQAWLDYFFKGAPSPLQDLVTTELADTKTYQVRREERGGGGGGVAF